MTERKVGETLSPEVVKARASQVAAAVLQQSVLGEKVVISKIASDLGLSNRTVARIMETEEYKALISEVGDKAVAEARNQLRSASSRLVPKAIKALEALLDDDSAKAKAEGVKGVFRLVGIDGNNDDSGKGGDIHILLPGATQPTTIEVPNVTSDKDPTD